jgi:hypothetical protein
VSQIALFGCQSPRVGDCSDLVIWQGVVVRCLLARVFVPMLRDGSLLAGRLLRLRALGAL